MAGLPKNSVWSAMDYRPPRGRCNHKTSLMSPACPCLRFMLHPVKAATSFECDGCSHHASFHSLENAAEDAVLRRWAEEEVKGGAQVTGGASKKKRKMIAQGATGVDDDGESFVSSGGGSRVSGRGKAAKKWITTGAATKTTMDYDEEARVVMEVSDD